MMTCDMKGRQVWLLEITFSQIGHVDVSIIEVFSDEASAKQGYIENLREYEPNGYYVNEYSIQEYEIA